MNAKRILVPIDLTDNSRFVLEAACEMARGMESQGGQPPIKLRLLHVLPELIAGEAPAPNLFEPAGDSYTRIKNAEAVLSNWEEELVPPENQDGVLAKIAPAAWRAICEEAEAYGADVVVIGAHRYSLAERALGTTVAKVVNHIKRPTYVVRPKASPNQQAQGEEKTGVPKTGQFAIFEASALAGITGGVAVGALAGPPGMIIGGTIGAAIGLLAGSVLDVEEQRTSKHDHELDDAIGVTSGDLGAKEMARAHLNEHKDEPGDEATTVTITKEASSLRADHERLEKLYQGLLDSYQQGDWRDVAAQWKKFEPAILAHLEFEETRVFPIFRQINQEEADRLLGEHNELRERLTTLGMNIDLHAMPQADATELVRRLRAHGEREEAILYPWIDLTIDAGPEPKPNGKRDAA